MRRKTMAAAAVLGLTVAGAVVAPQAARATDTSSGGFGTYSGATPLADIAPGAVLSTRTVSDHLAGLPLPVKAVQLAYRSTDALGGPTVNITSVLEPPVSNGGHQVISAQSAYDSLNPADEPSAEIAGNARLQGIASNDTTALGALFLLAGDPVVIPDTEGQAADFAAGPVYGMNTLDSIRAAMSSPATGIAADARVGLVGYSGGAIGTDWAAQLAPRYAPDVNGHLVGAAEGGLMVDPGHNLQYVNKSLVWSDVMPMAIEGIGRTYHLDLDPYLSALGTQLTTQAATSSIVDVMGRHPGLAFSQLTKPAYATPDSIQPLVDTVNKLNLSLAPMPTVPMLIVQGTNGLIEGTPPGGAGIGAGDGVMVAGDNRTLARDMCASGDAVDYQEYPLDHVGTVTPWAPAAEAWLAARLAGTAAPSTCGQIPAGNSLAPETYTP